MANVKNRLFDNSNSGAVFTNGKDKAGPLLSGKWENAQHHTFGLALSADVNGVRRIATLSSAGAVVLRGEVAKCTGKGPAYRGTLGKLDIVLWDMGTYYQVRIDKGVPQRTLRDDAAEFLGVATGSTTEHSEPRNDEIPF